MADVQTQPSRVSKAAGLSSSEVGRVFVPTADQRELVRLLAGYGIAHEAIGDVVRWPSGARVSPKTLRKHFRSELDDGRAHAIARMAEALFKSAMAGNTTAQIFWLKVRAGWREPPREIECFNHPLPTAHVATLGANL